MPPSTQELVDALDPQQRTVFEQMAAWLTKVSQAAARMLPESIDSSTAHSILLSCYGEAHAMRAAMCFVLGLDPMECANKEEAIDDFMRQRWEATNWAGWPDAD